jgi:hypothetical protein
MTGMTHHMELSGGLSFSFLKKEHLDLKKERLNFT